MVLIAVMAVVIISPIVVIGVIIAGFTAAVVAATVTYGVVGATIPIAHVVRCAVTSLKSVTRATRAGP